MIGSMFDRWCAARYRRLSVALILGCSIASIGATVSATAVLEPHAGTSSSDDTSGAATGSASRLGDPVGEQRSPWPWLIIAALIGLAPLAVERAYRGTATRRRHSRNDVALLEAEIEKLRALDRRHRAILEPLGLLADDIEIIDAEGDAMNDRGSSPPSGDAGNGRKLRILLAEDNEANQKVVCAHLLCAGHVVDVVENGRLAIAAIRRTTYDVVLMDIQMPGMDGVAATRAIRRLGGDVAKVPIIALTANAMVGDREKYISMGADDYISKPIESKELFGAIERFCGSRPDPSNFASRPRPDPRPDDAPEGDEEALGVIAARDDPVKPSW